MSCKIIGTAMERMLSSATGEWKHATYDITPYAAEGIGGLDDRPNRRRGPMTWRWCWRR